jgi:hypothetical protein
MAVSVQVHNLIASLTNAAKKGDMKAVAKWARELAVLADPAPVPPPVVVAPSDPAPDTSGFFTSGDDTPYIIGGSPANPNGVTWTANSAIAWWKAVFADGLNISHVRATLTPGSHVLTPAGLAAARALGVTSTVYAPEDYNPLNLPVVP